MAEKALDIVMSVQGAKEGESDLHKVGEAAHRVGEEAKEAGEKSKHGSEEAKKGFRELAASMKEATFAATGIREAMDFTMVAGGIFFLLDQLKEIFKVAIEDDAAVTDLAASLKLSGESSKEAVEEMEKFSESLVRVTTVSKGDLLKGMSQLASEGRLTGDSLKVATTAAIGLSERLHIDLGSAFSLVSRAALGNFEIMRRYGIEIDKTKTPLENFQNIMKEGQDALSISHERTTALSGAWSRFKNVLEQLRGAAGGAFKDLLVPVLNFMSTAIENSEVLAERLRVATKATVEYVSEGFHKLYENLYPIVIGMAHTLEDWGRVMYALASGAVMTLARDVAYLAEQLGHGAAAVFRWSYGVASNSEVIKRWKENLFAARVGAAIWLAEIEYAFTHWKDEIALGILRTQFTISFWGDVVKHVFTEVVPTYLHFLARNWRSILLDMVQGSMVVLQNLNTNFNNFFRALFNAMKGGGLHFDWTPLTDGFKSAMYELPQVAEQSFSQTTMTLYESVKKLGDELDKGMDDNVNKHVVGLIRQHAEEAKDIGKRAGESFADGFKEDAIKKFQDLKLGKIPGLEDLPDKLAVNHKTDLKNTFEEANAMLTGMHKQTTDVARDQRKQMVDQQIAANNKLDAIRQNTAGGGTGAGKAAEPNETSLLTMAVNALAAKVESIAKELEDFGTDRRKLQDTSTDIANNTDPNNAAYTDASTALG